MRPYLSLLQTQKCFSIAKKAALSLPKYPVPALHETLEKYLKSVKPFLSPSEYCQSEEIIKCFGSPGSIGEQLQFKLLEKAQKEDNWLKNWWLNTAYLEYRNPVVVYSSPGLVFPYQKFNSDKERLEYAAKLVAGALDYKSLIDDDKIPLEMMGKDPLDMSQYHKVFGTCRNPACPRDELKFHPGSQHIIVAYKNNFFKLDVKIKGRWMKYDEILQLLEKLIGQDCCEGPAIGLLTANDRDSWSKAFSELQRDNQNAASLKAIEESLFLLCLDDKKPDHCRNDKTTAGIQCVHGGGPKANSGNRWFDKTIQFIVSRDGSNGLTYEHSPSEGQPIAVLMDHIVNYISKAPTGNESSGTSPELLSFKVNDQIKSFIENAESSLQKLVDDLEFNCFTFKSYGKENIKQFKLSPDSFLQMAMQYAFYRIHQVPGAHYESASTRKFIDGRTETIRSCSEESIRFAKAMCNSQLSAQSKANALRVAVNAHKDYTIAALNARGVDRHLLGLKLLAKENKMPLPDIFNDIAFLRSAHMRISTSQVASKCDGFMVYGPLVEDGYACCYNPRSKDVNFGTTAFKSCKETDLDKFQENLETALEEMNDVLTRAPLAKL
ncbi:hypothetical protein O3M35_005320 [Rhynocoris fuscipes]|uniref:Choline/carnitine acyltransferase domain-containing protein n=1 Tax=Rhynocoris fuscipes TaxID=488301 RepID=A0AAW1DI99_9HEMI